MTVTTKAIAHDNGEPCFLHHCAECGNADHELCECDMLRCEQCDKWFCHDHAFNDSDGNGAFCHDCGYGWLTYRQTVALVDEVKQLKAAAEQNLHTSESPVEDSEPLCPNCNDSGGSLTRLQSVDPQAPIEEVWTDCPVCLNGRRPACGCEGRHLCSYHEGVNDAELPIGGIHKSCQSTLCYKMHDIEAEGCYHTPVACRCVIKRAEQSGQDKANAQIGKWLRGNYGFGLAGNVRNAVLGPDKIHDTLSIIEFQIIEPIEKGEYADHPS